MPTFSELYPFQSNYITIGPHRYHYLDEGEGPVVLMLHGNPTWSFYYRDLVKALCGTHRVIVPDHMGCGYSDKPQDYDYCLANHVANVKTLLAHLKIDSFAMVVHDWGGPIGLGVCVDMPEKLERIVVFNTTCELDGKYPWQIRMCRVPFVGEFAVRHFNLFARMAANIGMTEHKLDPDVRAGLLKPYDSYENRIATHRFVKDIPFQKDHPTLETGSEIMAKLDGLRNKPAMICWGMKDICFTPRFLVAWRKFYPNAVVHEFKKAGHYVVEDAIDEIRPLVTEFLAVEQETP